jgi:2-amino-4-hydroxy-6-hydroxymethyldihydropteridine diphosphokinase
MIECYLGLGSNLENPKEQIQAAISVLKTLPHSQLQATSPLYQSTPAGVAMQPNYYNAVVCLQTRLPPTQLLKHCMRIEAQQKRTRLKRWGARTLDIDILLYGTQTIQHPDLSIPHPRMHQRDFVLVPLLNIWPEAKLPDGTCLNHCLQMLETRYIKHEVRNDTETADI